MDLRNSYQIIEAPSFQKQKKDYNKKYLSIEKDVEVFKKVLLVRPDDGAPLKSDGNPPRLYLRKSRMGCRSLGRGQSGSFRVFYIQDLLKKEIHLLVMARRDDENKVDYRELYKYLELLNSYIVSD